MIECVIFDMDGVLVESEEFMRQAAIRMFAERGLTVQAEDFEPFVGSGENSYLGGVAKKYGFPFDLERDKARAYALYGEKAHGRLAPLPGVHEFFARCRDRNLLLALATSADEVKLHINLRELNLPEGTFAALVNGLDVERRKPHPDIFLLAAEKAHVPIAHCLVVEDAVNGVAAAKAAGARCLALTTSFPAEKLAGADWISSTLADAPDAAINW